jgi:hypothetical protein
MPHVDHGSGAKGNLEVPMLDRRVPHHGKSLEISPPSMADRLHTKCRLTEGEMIFGFVFLLCSTATSESFGSLLVFPSSLPITLPSLPLRVLDSSRSPHSCPLLRFTDN